MGRERLGGRGDAVFVAACFGGPVSLGVGALGAFVWSVTRSAPTGARVTLRAAPLGVLAALCAYLVLGAGSAHAAAGCLAWDEPPPGLVVRAYRRGGFVDIGSWYAFLFELPREQGGIPWATARTSLRPSSATSARPRSKGGTFARSLRGTTPS